MIWVGNGTRMGEMEIRIKFWPETLNANQDIYGKILLNGTLDVYGLRVTGQKIQFISVFNQLDEQNLFHNKFYFMLLHVSSTCARNM